MKRIYGLSLALLLCGAPLSLAAQDSEPVPSPTSPQTGDITQTLERQNPSPLPLMLPVLGDPVDPSGFFFVAEEMRNQAKDTGVTPDQQLSEFMYTLAFRFAKSPAAEEAGKSLFSLLSNQGRLAEAAAIAREWIQVFGPDWGMYRNLYDALMAQGSYPAALDLVSELSKALPGPAKGRSTELSWMEYNARSAMQDFGWTGNGLPFINAKTPDTYIAKVYRLYAAAPNVPQNIAALALFRAAATEKKYAEAVGCATPILPTFAMPDTPRAWISELGRSFYGAGAWQQGLGFFSAALGLEIRSFEVVLHNRMPDSTDATTTDANTEDTTAAPHSATPESALPTLDRARIPSELSWVMAFYLARMYQGMGESQTAASIFIELVPLAFSGEDSDSALWYWLDITMDSIAATDSLLGDLGQEGTNAMHAKRALEISALSQAAALWNRPSYFEDIVAGYMRRLLREGAWDDVVRLCALMSQKLTAAMRGPLLYVSGRLIETDRANVDLSDESDFWRWLAPGQQTSAPSPSTDAQNGNQGSAAGPQNVAQKAAPIFYSALLRENGIEEHYRTLAAWRLGIDPPLLANAPVLDKNFDIITAISSLYPNSEDPPVSDDKLKDVLDFIGQSLDYGLETLAADQVAALSPFSTDALLWLAMKFVQHEQYYPALRIGREALNRKSAAKPELGYALLYPRAWPEHFGELTAPRNIAEPLAYAIVRSESLFNQRAVSRSGAMGLSQLLPGTAAETARGLKMSQYALFNPKDNLTIGLTYYGYMLQRFDSRPVRAIAAYNAGPSRMAQWARDWGNIEDDILIELYPLAEPRQYTKNITAAALFYGKLYYGISAKDMLDFIYGIKPLPQQALPEEATNQTATATSSGSSPDFTGTSSSPTAVPEAASSTPQQTTPQTSLQVPTQSNGGSPPNLSP